jgi:hypothetical protein
MFLKRTLFAAQQQQRRTMAMKANLGLDGPAIGMHSWENVYVKPTLAELKTQRKHAGFWMAWCVLTSVGLATYTFTHPPSTYDARIEELRSELASAQQELAKD